MELPRVALINDFAAQAYGLLTLGRADIAAVAVGNAVVDSPDCGARRPRTGNRPRMRGARPRDRRRRPPVAVTSEGGHMGFVAETDADRRILEVARAKFGRTSWERVCCGAGLALVHHALHPDDGMAGVADGDPSAVVERAKADPASDAARSVGSTAGSSAPSPATSRWCSTRRAASI